MSFLTYNTPAVDSTAALRTDIYQDKTQACISDVFQECMLPIPKWQDFLEYSQVGRCKNHALSPG